MSVVNEHMAHEPCVSPVETGRHAEIDLDAVLLTLGKLSVGKDQLEKEVEYLRDTINAERLMHAKTEEMHLMEQQRIKISANNMIEELKAENTILDTVSRDASDSVRRLRLKGDRAYTTIEKLTLELESTHAYIAIEDYRMVQQLREKRKLESKLNKAKGTIKRLNAEKKACHDSYQRNLLIDFHERLVEASQEHTAPEAELPEA